MHLAIGLLCGYDNAVKFFQRRLCEQAAGQREIFLGRKTKTLDDPF